MELNDLIRRLKVVFKENGEIPILPGESINDLVIKYNCPNEYGVYLITAYKNDIPELIDIGKSGTIKQNGKFKEQTLKKRLTKKQEGIYRAEYFNKLIQEEGLDKLVINWFVTINGNDGYLPAYVEARLLQIYFSHFKSLPRKNLEL